MYVVDVPWKFLQEHTLIPNVLEQTLIPKLTESLEKIC